ncbi:MAG: transcription antitermination factor NusB [Candidatus Omnitrophica bacterium]|jgi:N utilization substance protein B|nr:transcription antitermination factor NusB [Candidatus Omnitrophota bacterium]
MRKRTLARECALQILYQIDITGQFDDKTMPDFWSSREDVEQVSQSFANQLVQGVLDHKEALDKIISQYATNWRLDRMAVVDRNVLRLSCYELMFCDDIPPKVAINEAVDLAKKFSAPESGKFVNGIVDKIKQEKQKHIKDL